MKILPVYACKNIVGYLKIDNCDFKRFQNCRIYLINGYPSTAVGHGRKNRKPKYIHRLIMGEPKDMQIDHINHNLYDVRRRNLRIVNNKTNNENRSIYISNSSGFRGVSKCRDKWRAYVVHNYKQIHCGVFASPELAAKAAADKRKSLGYLDFGKAPK